METLLNISHDHLPLNPCQVCFNFSQDEEGRSSRVEADRKGLNVQVEKERELRQKVSCFACKHCCKSGDYNCKISVACH